MVFNIQRSNISSHIKKTSLQDLVHIPESDFLSNKSTECNIPSDCVSTQSWLGLIADPFREFDVSPGLANHLEVCIDASALAFDYVSLRSELPF